MASTIRLEKIEANGAQEAQSVRAETGSSSEGMARGPAAAAEARAARKAAGIPSLRTAINAFCTYCIVDTRAAGLGSPAAQIRACESRDCPLWRVRPGAGKGNFPENIQ